MGTEVTTVRFHGASLLVQVGDGPQNTLVAMKPVVEGMGLAWQTQHRKLNAHPILAQGITEMVIPSQGGHQAMTAIPLNRLPFWLATLHPNKITDLAVREKVIIYQIEAADALFERFFGPAIHSPVTNVSISRRVAAIVEDKIDRRLPAILDEALLRLLPILLEDKLRADERAIAVDYKPALLILVERKVPPPKRRAFSQRVSNSLRRFCADRGFMMRTSRESGRWLFPVDGIYAWLAYEGERMIQDHIASTSRQGTLALVHP